MILTADFSDRDDKDCVGDALTAFAKISSDAMLVCWEQETLPDIAEDLGVNDVPSWPKTRLDLTFLFLWIYR